jgi:hypothetical protein
MSIVKMLGKILLCLVLAIVLASLASWYAFSSLQRTIEIGPWKTTFTSEDSQTGGLYSRIRKANWGGGMRPSEALYFLATTDSKGERLSHSCTYRIEGNDPDARWWSITAYTSAGSLIANPHHLYSISKTTVVRKSDGSWTVRLSRQKQPENWMPLAAEDSAFAVILRCYVPSTAFLTNPTAYPLPQILFEGCQ